ARRSRSVPGYVRLRRPRVAPGRIPARPGARTVGFMSENAATTKQLTKRYGDRVAVDAVSMTVRRGEVYGFLGPNGAGKTTTLRMLLGLVRPTSGAASILGRPAGRPHPPGTVGALIEGPGFFPYL